MAGEAFHFDVAGIHAQPGGDVIARHVDDRWLVGKDFFLKIECRTTAVECVFDEGKRSQQRQGLSTR